MLTIDWVLLAVWIIGTIKGWRQGLIRQLVSLVAFFGGLLLAKAFYAALGNALCPHLNNQVTLSNIVAFVLIWIGVPMALGLAGELLSKVFDKLILLGTVNYLLGSLSGLLKYEVILGAFVWVFATVGIINKETMEESALCGPLKAVPEAIYTALMDKNVTEE